MQQRMAERLVTLTGDRQRAATLFAKGRELIRTRATESQRKADLADNVVGGRVRYPAWWPEEGSATSPPADAR